MNAANGRRRRVFLRRPDFFQELNDEKFYRRFRFSKDTVRYIIDLIRDEIEPITQRSHSIGADLQVFIALRFYAIGCFQETAGELSGVSQATVCRVVKRVSRCLAHLKRRFIYMPTGHERADVRRGLRDIAGLPEIVGVIDCTHVRIKRPSVPNYRAFRNRRGVYSINVQLVCDHRMRIRNVVARWPGSVHDSRIFQNSRLSKICEAGQLRGHLIGDSGYRCSEYLLTPVLRPQNDQEERYNEAHASTRNVIERCNGLLKVKFKCLSCDSRMRLNKDTTMTVIVAACVLHNIAIDRNDLDIYDDDIQIENNNNQNNAPQNQQGNAYRRRFIARHF